MFHDCVKKKKERNWGGWKREKDGGVERCYRLDENGGSGHHWHPSHTKGEAARGWAPVINKPLRSPLGHRYMARPHPVVANIWHDRDHLNTELWRPTSQGYLWSLGLTAMPEERGGTHKKTRRYIIYARRHAWTTCMNTQKNPAFLDLEVSLAVKEIAACAKMILSRHIYSWQHHTKRKTKKKREGGASQIALQGGQAQLVCTKRCQTETAGAKIAQLIHDWALLNY